MSTIVCIHPLEVAERLGGLSLDIGTIRQAVTFGQSYVAESTAHDPPSSVGIIAWGKTVRALRDSLVPQGWSAENRQNYALTVHPDGAWVIAVAAGNEQTGLSRGFPETRAPKGPLTSIAVSANNRQLSFAEVDEAWDPTRQTWLLLYYFDEDRDQVRIELSLPVGMNADRYVNKWRERIILPIEEPDIQVAEDDDDDFDVPVEIKM